MEENKPGEVELSVILVNYNDRAHLRECLSSLRSEIHSLRSEVLLVDNFSHDGSQALVASDFSWVRLLQNRENVGFARANNQGIRESRGEYLLFLNTDTVILPSSIGALLTEIKGRPSAGAVGPALLRYDGSYQVSFGRKVDFFSEIRQKFFFNPYFKIVLKKSSKSRKVAWLSGACLMARRSAVEEAGLFDENFFLYFEDIDLCRRLRTKGWELIFFPGARIIHIGGASTAAQPLSSRIEYRKSQFIYYRKHNSRAALFLLKIYLRLVFAFLLSRKLPEDEEMRIRAELARIFASDKEI